MNAWKAILATLVIFGAGVLTGGLLVSYSDRALNPAPAKAPAVAENPPSPARPVPIQSAPAGPRENPNQNPNRLPTVVPVLLRKEFIDRLSHEITLSPEQRERIERILAEGQERTREASQQTFRQIRGELTPEQRVRFEELMKRPRDPRRQVPTRDRPPTNLPADFAPNPAR